MAIYAAHVYVISDEGKAYYEIGYDNEVEPKLAIKGSYSQFISKFMNNDNREKLISDAFDANYGVDHTDDELYGRKIRPHTLQDEVDNAIDEYFVDSYRDFSNEIASMQEIQFVLFAVDSNKHDWGGYSAYWYDAIAIDFGDRCIYSVEWRGTDIDQKNDMCYLAPFKRKTADYLIEMIADDRADEIDVGDFMLKECTMGKISVIEI